MILYIVVCVCVQKKCEERKSGHATIFFFRQTAKPPSVKLKARRFWVVGVWKNKECLCVCSSCSALLLHQPVDNQLHLSPALLLISLCIYS
jgi:hypothetical protein